MHCLTAWGQWAVGLPQYTAPLPGGSGQWTSCNAPPHCLGAVGSGPPAIHCPTAWGQWAVGVVWCGVVWCGVVWCGVVWCGVVWCGVPKALLPEGKGRDVYPRVQVNGWGCVCCVRAVCSCNTLPHCLGAVGSGTPAIHCRTAWGQWAGKFLHCTAAPPGGSGRCNSCNALPHCLGAVGSGTPAIHRLTARGQWAVELLQYTASLPGGSGQCNSCNTLPQCLGAVGSETPATHCLTAWGQWAVGLLQCTSPHLTSPHLTSPHLTSPHLTSHLVTWHQSKNPQDGSCRTDCLHALPRSKPVVIRHDSRAIA